MKPKQRDSFWFSKISDFQLCPKKYERIHLLDEKDHLKNKSGDLLFGSVFHSALENLANGGDTYLDIFDVYWGALKERQDIVWGRYGWEWLNEIGPKMLKRYKKVYAPLIDPVLVEKRMYGRWGSHKSEGTPDEIAYYDGVLSMIDFKTSGYRYDKNKIVIAEQLIGYSRLYHQSSLFKVHGPIKQIVYFVFCKDKGSIQKPLILPLTDEHEVDTIANTAAVIDQIKAAKEFPMNKTSCIRGPIRCPFFEKCHGKYKENK